MRSLICFFWALIYSSSLLACANFSGIYRNEDDPGSILEFSQDHCTGLTLTTTNLRPKASILLYGDREFHVSYKRDILMDNEIIGYKMIVTSHGHFEGKNSFSVRYYIVTEVFDEREQVDQFNRYSLDPDNNINVLVSYNNESRTIKYLKVK